MAAYRPQAISCRYARRCFFATKIIAIRQYLLLLLRRYDILLSRAPCYYYDAWRRCVQLYDRSFSTESGMMIIYHAFIELLRILP